ncbi:MAG TPA: hypothetical protein VIY48_09580, partial [Candidatus Paceibacterota bacterium]
EHEMDDIFVLKSGLNPNEKIVLEGVRALHDGQKLGEIEFVKPEEALAHQKQHGKNSKKKSALTSWCTTGALLCASTPRCYRKRSWP